MTTTEQGIVHKDIPDFEYNYISDGVHIGTNACCVDHLNDMLKEHGIEADMSLEDDRLDSPFGVKFYVWVPVVDHTPPDPEQMEFGARVIKTWVDMGKKIYLHCKNGHGRAPTMYAGYLIRYKDMSADEAIAHIKEKRPTMHLDELQVTALRQAEINCREKGQIL